MVWISAVASVALAASYGLYRALLLHHGLRARVAFTLWLLGALLSVPLRLLTGYILDSAGWRVSVGPQVSAWSAWMVTVGVVVALEQIALVVLVWPSYRVRRLEHLATAISSVGMACMGLGAGLGAMAVAAQPSGAVTVAALGSLLSRTFSSGLWAGCLSTSHSKYRRWLPLAWLSALLLDGFLRHLLVARGPGFQLVASAPLLAMLLAAWLLLGKLRGPRASVILGQASRFGIHLDAQRLDGVRAAFEHAHRPALIHWIFGGALVTFGTTLVGLVGGAFLAHALAIDLSRVDESSAESLAPLLLLGGTVLLSFVVAGYLTAKASAADSLFEPAMSALISIVALTLLLARSAPMSLVLGLAMTPMAFALACFGAWFGLVRPVARG